LTPGNIREVDELATFCIEQRIGFRLSPVRDTSSHKQPGAVETYIDKLTLLYDKLGRELPVDMPLERFARFAEWNLKRPKQIACGTCSGMMAIDQTGNTSSCQMRLDVPLGNVTSEPMAEVWQRVRLHPDNEFLVHPERKSRECTTCAWQRTCAGGCPEHTRLVSATTNAPSPWCDLYYTLFPVYVRSVARQMKRRLHAHVPSAMAI
jgi:radical SAM protein with 4Fe4S-binding SPASM domain